MREASIPGVQSDEAAARPRWWLTRNALTLLLALVGTADAAYLTYVHYNMSALVCTIGSCHTVQTSRYAVIAGVPIAVLGLGMYLAVIALVAARWARPDWGYGASLAAFAILLAGTLYAAYLTYIEISVIHAICQYCVLSALLTLALLIVEGTAVYHLVMDMPEA